MSNSELTRCATYSWNPASIPLPVGVSLPSGKQGEALIFAPQR
ncbi:MAG: hypothetical protein ACYT04_84900 [Nostoc sp.]